MTILCEVKEFAPDDDLFRDGDWAFRGGEIYRGIRVKIGEAWPQFAAAGERPCLLVLQPGGPLVGGFALSTPEFAFAARLGDLEFRASVDPVQRRMLLEDAKTVFASGGQMINPRTGNEQNTLISAVRAIGGNRDDPRMTFYENPFAKHPLPRSVFRDKRDRRFALDESGVLEIPAVNGADVAQ